MREAFPLPRLWDLPLDLRATLAETASQAIWVPRPGPGTGVRPTFLEGWHLSQGRSGLLLLSGSATRLDGRASEVSVVPVLIEERLAWTPIGWLDLGVCREEPEPDRQAALLARAETWCADLRRMLLA